MSLLNRGTDVRISLVVLLFYVGQNHCRPLLQTGTSCVRLLYLLDSNRGTPFGEFWADESTSFSNLDYSKSDLYKWVDTPHLFNSALLYPQESSLPSHTQFVIPMCSLRRNTGAQGILEP